VRERQGDRDRDTETDRDRDGETDTERTRQLRHLLEFKLHTPAICISFQTGYAII